MARGRKKSILEECPEEVYKLKGEIIDKFFPDLINAKFKMLFYDKKKVSRGRSTLAYIRCASDVEKLLSKESTPEELDYFIFIDKNVWTEISPIDRTRLVRHELRHCFVDLEANKPYKLIGHDVEDFYAEIELATEEGDLRWCERVNTVAESIYEKKKDDKS